MYFFLPVDTQPSFMEIPLAHPMCYLLFEMATQQTTVWTYHNAFSHPSLSPTTRHWVTFIGNEARPREKEREN